MAYSFYLVVLSMTALHLRVLIPCKKINIDGRLYQLVGNSRGRRQPQRSFLIPRPSSLIQVTRSHFQSFLNLLNLKPPRIFKLRVMLEVDRLVRGVADLRNGANHQVSRVRPWLG